MLTTIEKVLFFQQLPLFQSVPTEALAHLSHVSEEVHASDGETLFRPGDLADRVYFVMRGEVELEGEHGIRGKKPAGSDVGASALVGKAGARRLSAHAVGQVALLVVTREDFFEVVGEHPELAEALLIELGNRWGADNPCSLALDLSLVATP
ncbi:MAG: cyclic nucleotide-binding domain-containing protein [Deltaproteobacteria bacterium]|nr:cyclic nucleotide-binding domain-containing protein [Deltaproteobacteria bacterium]